MHHNPASFIPTSFRAAHISALELALALITIRHLTTYAYHQPVSLGPHRLMLRPRESRDLKLVSHDLAITPSARVTWSQDVAGNAVANSSFQGISDRLVIDSLAIIDLNAAPWPVFEIAGFAISFPFSYSASEWTDLGALSQPQYADPAGRLLAWAQAFVRGASTDTLSLLKDMNEGISGWITYQAREDEGTQGPLETLDRGTGSCRDFAVLLVEALRVLGFGARLVSGYLHNPNLASIGSAGGGSTHAWAEVYVPGAGWITFDPTNRSVGGINLIPVAVARDIHQIMPVTGSFSGMNDAFQSMMVEVSVTS